MARNYASGTAAGASTLAAGLAMLSSIRDTILANGGWSLVEEISGSSFQVVVVKATAANSGLSSDLFVAIVFDKNNLNMLPHIGDAYDVTNHVLSASPSPSDSTSIAIAANGAPAVTPTITFNASSGTPTFANGASNYYTYNAISGVSIYWQCVVDADHIMLSSNRLFWYIGAITPVMAGDTMPVVAVDFYDTNYASQQYNTNNRALRLPPGAATPQRRQDFWILGPGSSATYGAIRPGNLVQSGQADHCLGDKPPVFEYAAMHDPAKAAQIGGFRGRYKKLLIAPVAPSGSALGDVFPIDGTRWALWVFTSAGAVLVDTGVAV